MSEDDFDQQWKAVCRRLTESFAEMSASLERFATALAAAAPEEWPEVVLEDTLDAEYIE